MKHIRFVCLLIVFLAAGAATLTTTAQGQSASGKYTVYGAGTKSCGQWVQEKEKDAATQPKFISIYGTYQDWVLGFVSGSGYAAVADLHETDSGGITTFMDTYCQAHPLESIATAAAALVNELKKRQ